MKGRWIGALLVMAAVGCGGGIKEDPILRMSSEEALETGKRLFEEEKWVLAREHLTHAFEVAPNSAGGREALLLVADAHFLQGGRENWIKAEAKYRDFQTRFPTSDRSDYVQFQIAESLARRVAKPDRDQSVTRDALEAYRTVVQVYPTSEYAALARENTGEVLDNLAAHEYKIAFFYFRYGNSRGAVGRLEGLLDQYPEYSGREEALVLLVRAYLKSDEPEKAPGALERLRTEFPDSESISKLADRVDS